jgi:hypothetical protein
MPGVVKTGSLGIDFSVNPSIVPASGFSLLQTVPARKFRIAITVQNQSAGPVQVVRDDGAGGQVTTIMLSAAAEAGGAGGVWSSETFKGRVRVYSPDALAQVSISED